MGLEAPLALLGLLGALVPLIAHRIRRRDLTPVPLPTIAMLQLAEAAKRKSRGVTDLLLLVLRIAILSAAALALSAPYVTARLSFGDGTIASVAVVLDDSMSMMQRHNDISLLENALGQARGAIDSLPAGSEIALIATGHPARVLVSRTSDLALARSALDAMPDRSMRGNDLPLALTLAVQQLAGARHASRRLLVLSDLAAHTGIANETLALEGIATTLERVGSGEPQANLYFSSVSALLDPTAEGQTSISFELASSGEAPPRVPVSVHAGGREVARTQLDLVNGRAREVIHVPAAGPQGDPTALLRIEVDDALVEDNEAGVLLRRTDALSVMLVNGDPHPASDDDELHYALSALRLSPVPLSLRSVDEGTLAQHDLSKIDVVILANVAAPAPALAERLVSFVRGGGGLIVSGGDQVVPHRYNAAFGSILPARIRARATGKPELMRDGPDASAVLPAGPSGLAHASAHQRLVLESGGRVVLQFADGTAALTVGDAERGRCALFATTLDDDWGDLPFRPGFLPLLSNLVRDVANANNLISGPVPAGEPVTLGVPPAATRVEVVSPEGVRHRFDEVDASRTIVFEDTDKPGPYRFMAASGHGALGDLPRGAFIVQPPPKESDLTPASDVAGGGQGVVRQSSAAHVKRTLAPYVFVFFALLVLSEGLLRLRVR